MSLLKGVSGMENNKLQLKVSKDGRCRYKQGSDPKCPITKVSIAKTSELLISSVRSEGRFI